MHKRIERLLTGLGMTVVLSGSFFGVASAQAGEGSREYQARELRLDYAPATASAAPASSPATAPSETLRLFIPIVTSAPSVDIQFASARDAEDNLVNPSNTIAFGTTSLEYDILLLGTKGRSIRREWTINGAREPGLDRTSTAIDDAEIQGGSIVFTDGSSLDRGTYTLIVYIDDVVFKEATATIQ
ncbi:MAG: hypothetical protein H7Z42_20300 [Roseiflexaceae bacterium]|nr:hypothetical protein [Roseiflexaceae bacterium]